MHVNLIWVKLINAISHVGHIITSSLFGGDDIIQRRNTCVGQTNIVLCFFNKLNTIVKLKLFKSYCTSIYGAELWALGSANIETFCVAWRKALRRILQLPYNSHSVFLPSLSNTSPVYDEICKRSMKFIATTLVSSNMLDQACLFHLTLISLSFTVISFTPIFMLFDL